MHEVFGNDNDNDSINVDIQDNEDLLGHNRNRDGHIEDDEAELRGSREDRRNGSQKQSNDGCKGQNYPAVPFIVPMSGKPGI